ncbi:MAG: hypothetical protein R2854_28885 [Caldilineaceae bacterium]
MREVSPVISNWRANEPARLPGAARHPRHQRNRHARADAAPARAWGILPRR